MAVDRRLTKHTLSSTSNSFFEPNPSILVIAVYMMILHRANENPRVVGDRSDRDNEYMEYMKGEKEATEGTA